MCVSLISMNKDKESVIDIDMNMITQFDGLKGKTELPLSV